MDYRLFQRKYLLGCPGKLREVSKQQQVRVATLLSLYPHSFLLLAVAFSQSHVLPDKLCSKPFQHILDIVGLSQGNLEEHVKQAG